MANTQCIRQVVGIALGLLAWTSAQGGGPYSIHTVSPCRVVDTREADGALSTFSGGPLTPGETVAFHVLGAAIAGQGGASDCGVPSSATGVFINIVAVGPSGAGDSGFLTLYPYGETLPLASTINYAYDTTAVANGVMVPVCDSAVATCDYSLNAYNHVALSVDLVIDVTGYLTD